MSKDLNEMLAETLISNTANKLHEIVADKVNSIQVDLEQKIDKLENDCKNKVNKLECYISGKPLTVNLGTLQSPKNKMVHKAFDTVIRILQSCKRINKNIMLVGEAGCVDCDTEYFNGEKWVKISEYKDGDLVLEYNDKTKQAILSKPLAYIKAPCEKMYYLKSKYGIDQMVSEEHNIAYITSKGNFYKQKASKFVERYNNSVNGLKDKFITTFSYNGSGINLSDSEIKIMLAVICDGSIYGNNKCRFHIKKDRKKVELRKIFKEANIEYIENESSAEGYSDFYINPPIFSKKFTKEWYNCSQKQLELICDNILQWDGSISNNRMSFSTTDKENADFVQFAFTACGYKTTLNVHDRRGRVRKINNKEYITKSIDYTLSISKRVFTSLNNKNKDNISIVNTKDGYKYCFTMPTSNLILRRNGRIFVTGNSGKSSLCADVASALNLPFYPMSVGLQTTKSDLLGFISATGEYMTTPLRQAFENGGVILLDEFDATHAGVVTILNSMLANDICSFPDKIVNKHKDFVCIVACNTYCKGGSLEYIGRNRLDSATLDRFISVNVGYDETLEDSLTGNSDWLKVIRQMRDNIKSAVLKVVISPRASMQGADLLDAGFSIEEVLEMVIYKGVSDDVKTKIVKDVNFNIFNKKKKDTKTSKSANLNEPMQVKINFNTLEYDVTNIVSDTSIIKRADWKGEYSVYFSTRNGYDAKLDEKGLYLNYGKGNKLKEAKRDNIDKFIRELNTYSDTIDTEFQPITFTLIYGENEIKIYVK